MRGTMGEAVVKKERQANIELLRSVCMLFVITLHYLDKGGVLEDLTAKQDIYGYLAWLLKSFAIVAVNTYVLISGYFLTDTGFKVRRIVNLVLQILFYTWTVPLILAAFGIISFQGMGIYDFLFYLFPIQMKHYWFATSYLILYILSPVLAAGVKELSQKTLERVLFAFLLLLSVGKSIIPFILDMDQRGYDALWFIGMFLTGAYIRKYGCHILTNKKRAFLCYAGSCVGIFVLANVIAVLVNKTGKGEYFISNTFHYNHILCYTGAVGLFLLFRYWNMKPGFLAKLAVAMGPYTFGVYLLHENTDIRYLWPKWLAVEKFAHTPYFLLHYVGSILFVFVIGIAIDKLRSLLFYVLRISKKP